MAGGEACNKHKTYVLVCQGVGEAITLLSQSRQMSLRRSIATEAISRSLENAKNRGLLATAWYRSGWKERPALAMTQPGCQGVGERDYV